MEARSTYLRGFSGSLGEKVMILVPDGFTSPRSAEDGLEGLRVSSEALRCSRGPGCCELRNVVRISVAMPDTSAEYTEVHYEHQEMKAVSTASSTSCTFFLEVRSTAHHRVCRSCRQKSRKARRQNAQRDCTSETLTYVNSISRLHSTFLQRVFRIELASASMPKSSTLWYNCMFSRYE